MNGVRSKDSDRCESDDATRREESKKFAGIRRLTVADFLAQMPVLLSEEADGLSCALKRRERLIDLRGDEVDLLILATPVSAILDWLDRVPQVFSGEFHLLDLGSTKTQIVERMQTLPDRISPLGGHPMCGRETSGLSEADGDLYHGCVFALTPLERYNLVDSEFAFTVAGITTAAEFCEFARSFGDDTELSVWQRLSAAFGALDVRPERDPVLVLDFLHHFHNPDIPIDVRRRVLRQCCKCMEYLALVRPLVVFVQALQTDEYRSFFSIIENIADEVLQAPAARPVEVLQPALF